MHRVLVVVAVAVAALALSACPEKKGKEMIEEAREAHKDAINDIGGAPKTQIDHTAGRVQGQYQQGGDRLEDAFKTDE